MEVMFIVLFLCLLPLASPTVVFPNQCGQERCAFGNQCHNVAGKPKCACVLKFRCTNHKLTVCGSDGKTYSNQCKMTADACNTNKNIVVAHLGPCRSALPSACPKLLAPCSFLKPSQCSTGKDCTGNHIICCRQDVCGHRRCYDTKKKQFVQPGSQLNCANKLCPPGQVCRLVNGKPHCMCLTVCLAIYKPVCGSDNKTYSNVCRMRAQACVTKTVITVKHQGACGTQTCTCPRFQVCEMKSGKAQCVMPKKCQKIYRPVCGSDGKTHSNACLMNVQACVAKIKILIVHQGPCTGLTCANVLCAPNKPICQMINGKPQCICSKVCPTVVQPVCGSDGKTYNNVCLLKVQACVSNKPITVKHPGACASCSVVKCSSGRVCRVVNNKAICVCNLACPRILSPVCGSDGKTYNNECLLKVQACVSNTIITVKHQGACKARTCAQITCPRFQVCEMKSGKGQCVMPRKCQKIYRPVCGSDGKTHSNACLMNVQACLAKTKIFIVHQGPCTGSAMICPPASRRPCLVKPPPLDRCLTGDHCPGKHVICCQDVCNQRCYNTRTKTFTPDKKCPARRCARRLAQVCGSDGVTYYNLCLLQEAACWQPWLRKLHNGECACNKHP